MGLLKKKEAGVKSVNLNLLEEKYIDALIRWRSQPDAQAHQPISPLNREHFLRFLENRKSDTFTDLKDNEYILIIEDADTGNAVGWMTLEITSLLHGLGRLGYTIRNKCWGQGYATAAVKMLASTLFNATRIYRLEADCSIYNPASMRVLEKCGFVDIGIKHDYLVIHGERIDHHYYELLKPNFLF